MKYMLTDLYQTSYRLFKNKFFAKTIAISLLSFFALIIIHALLLLMEEMLVPLAGMIKLFIFPYNITVFSLLFIFHLWLMPSKRVRSKSIKREMRNGATIIFTCIALFSYLYIQFADKIIF